MVPHNHPSALIAQHLGFRQFFILVDPLYCCKTCNDVVGREEDDEVSIRVNFWELERESADWRARGRSQR